MVSVYRPTFVHYNRAVTLAEYAYIIQYDEPAFWGVYYDDQPNYACTNLWTEYMRNNVARALAHAQEMIEDYLHFFLADTWVVGTLGESDAYQDFRLVDAGDYTLPYYTRYGRIQQFGVRAETDLGTQAVDHLSDPAVVGPIVTTLGSPREIRIYYPGTEREIQSSRVIYAGGEVIIQIPRVRLLKENLLWQTGDNRDEIRYEDTGNFLEEVDVRRVYTDPTTQAKLVGNHVCNTFCAGGGCSEYTVDACAYVTDPDNGFVEIFPGVYRDNAWVVNRSLTCRGQYGRVRLYYKSGMTALSVHIQEAVVRLAHSLMAEEPCGCALTQRLWARDRETPNYITRQRAKNPFGVTEGAWWAYERVKTLKTRLKMGVVV